MKIEKGNYKGKHPSAAAPDLVIQEAVRKKIVNGKITCGDAENIARTLVKPLPEIGTVLDLMETQIVKCQLGLFGYYPEQKIVSPAQKVDPRVEEAVRTKLINGRLPCQEAWEIAKTFSLPRIDVAAVCEARGLKIRPCQLGAF